MVNYACEHYCGDEETNYCSKKGYFLDCRGCHGFKKQVKLRAMIIQKCMTVRRFADKVGLSESMMSRMLNGSRIIMEWHYDRFAKELGITVEELKGVIE